MSEQRSGGDSVTPQTENLGGEQSSPSAEVDVAKLLCIAEVMAMVAADCEADAKALDETAFTPRGVGEAFGTALAQIKAIAEANRVLASTLAALAASQEKTDV